MNTELLNIIARIVLAILGVVITYYIIPLLKSKIDTDKWNEMMSFIEKCVEAAEKKFTPEEWQLKKSYVLSLVSAKIDTLGINLSPDEIDALIEGFVKAVKG